MRENDRDSNVILFAFRNWRMWFDIRHYAPEKTQQQNENGHHDATAPSASGKRIAAICSTCKLPTEVPSPYFRWNDDQSVPTQTENLAELGNHVALHLGNSGTRGAAISCPFEWTNNSFNKPHLHNNKDRTCGKFGAKGHIDIISRQRALKHANELAIAHRYIYDSNDALKDPLFAQASLTFRTSSRLELLKAGKLV